MSGGASLLAAGAVCALIDASAVNLAGADVRLAEIASLDCIAHEHRKRIGDLSIATMTGERALTRSALATLVRRRVPALANIDLGGDADASIQLRPPRQAVAHQSCYAARRPIELGAAISAEHLEQAACATRARTGLVRYDRAAGVARATQPIIAGDHLGRMMASPPAAEAGDELTLTVALGPVTIQRTVQAVQTSRGGAVFVRDADGRVFPARLSPEPAP